VAKCPGPGSTSTRVPGRTRWGRASTRANAARAKALSAKAGCASVGFQSQAVMQDFAGDFSGAAPSCVGVSA
jgi:hypothetical protein